MPHSSVTVYPYISKTAGNNTYIFLHVVFDMHLKHCPIENRTQPRNTTEKKHRNVEIYQSNLFHLTLFIFL